MNLLANHHFRDNIIFIAISLSAVLAQPAIVPAQENPYNPINFTQELSLSRGNLFPSSSQSVYLNHDESCDIAKEAFGWSEASCAKLEKLVFSYTPDIDTLVIKKPDSQGHVSFDDWSEGDVEGEIDVMWNDFVEASKEQSKTLGVDIRPIKWLVYPTLNKQKSYLYYAIQVDWGGKSTTNISANLFDRRGYVPFTIIPASSNLSKAELVAVIEDVLHSYSPNQDQSYFAFKEGDKIAAAGALGVLATLLGVKYGKAAGAGLLALVLILVKKLWFLVFLPFVFLKNKLFGNKKEVGAKED